MLSTNWPFPQPPNCAVLTLSSIAFAGEPILFVRHTMEDDGWEFFDAKPPDLGRRGSIVQLGAIANLDASILELADLPPGWIARRKSPQHPWQQMPGIISKPQ